MGLRRCSVISPVPLSLCLRCSVIYPHQLAPAQQSSSRAPVEAYPSPQPPSRPRAALIWPLSQPTKGDSRGGRIIFRGGAQIGPGGVEEWSQHWRVKPISSQQCSVTQSRHRIRNTHISHNTPENIHTRAHTETHKPQSQKNPPHTHANRHRICTSPLSHTFTRTVTQTM